jgi:MFS family permease
MVTYDTFRIFYTRKRTAFLFFFVEKFKHSKTFKYFWIFVITRIFIGAGQASFSCIAPTIIGDLFIGEKRTLMLAAFNLATPVGSGLGYIVGSNIASAFNDWRWALRFGSPLCFISIILLLILVNEPKRGEAEGSMSSESKTSAKNDVLYLLKQ